MGMESREKEKTGFQESAPFHASFDLQTDFVMVYGIDDSLPQRIQQWKAKGYIVHLMTGVAWGEYQRYLNGDIDGRTHWDEAQTNRHGDPISHGVDVPYMVPTIAFSNFLTERIKVAIDAGVEAIHLEEPEFWVDGGYSEAFKREWQIHYKEKWQPPHSSVDAQFKASQLKAYLYTRTLDRLCDELKAYALIEYDRFLRFYVPTHSLLNYTQWRIVSPESRLLDVPSVDGYIAQVWTGTARTPNLYEGLRKERTFETAFLEYGAMQELVRGTDRQLWFLHDPIEDNPRYTWSDYEQNYKKTVVASLLHPAVSSYEVAPWPRRIFQGTYPKEALEGKESIPSDYATTLLIVMNTLRDMDQADVTIHGGMDQIGVIVSDSMMYQRGEIVADHTKVSSKYDGTGGNSLDQRQTDQLNFSEFYGLALPFLKRGMWIRPVQLDQVRRHPHYFEDYRLLILSYEFQKPQTPDMHAALARWVQEGGVLVYVGDDKDPYHQISAWWNNGKKTHASPREHLFEALGLATNSDEEGVFTVGRGAVGYIKQSPVSCATNQVDAERLRTVAKEGFTRCNKALPWKEQHYFMLQRGPYKVVSVLEESVSSAPVLIHGTYVDLFDAALPIINNPDYAIGEVAFLYDVYHRKNENDVELIAASSRVEKLEVHPKGFIMDVRGPEDIKAVARLYCPIEPTHADVIIDEKTSPIPFEWDPATKTVRLAYAHQPNVEFTKISVRW